MTKRIAIGEFGVIFSTAAAYILYFRLIENVDSTQASTFTYLSPALAKVLGAVILREPVTSSMIFGYSLILLGTAIANDLFKHLLKKTDQVVK